MLVGLAVGLDVGPGSVGTFDGGAVGLNVVGGIVGPGPVGTLDGREVG
jgi:hypothetical protein